MTWTLLYDPQGNLIDLKDDTSYRVANTEVFNEKPEFFNEYRVPLKKRVDDAYVDRPQSDIDEETWAAIRLKRNHLLKKTDLTQVVDSPLSEDLRKQWKEYRKTLRDITKAKSPSEVVWPTPPKEPRIKWVNSEVG